MNELEWQRHCSAKLRELAHKPVSHWTEEDDRRVAAYEKAEGLPPVRLVLGRVQRDDAPHDVLRCGHILLIRPLPLGPNETIGARRCVRCLFERPPDDPKVAKMPQAEFMKQHWEWWFAEHKIPMKQLPSLFADSA